MATSCFNTAYWLIHLFLHISMLPFPYTNFLFVLRPRFGLLVFPLFCPQNSTTVLNIAPLQSIWEDEASTWICITFFFRIFLKTLWLSVSLFSHLSHSFSYSKIHVKEAPPPCYLWISFPTALFNLILGFTLSFLSPLLDREFHESRGMYPWVIHLKTQNQTQSVSVASIVIYYYLLMVS